MKKNKDFLLLILAAIMAMKILVNFYQDQETNHQSSIKVEEKSAIFRQADL